MALVKKSKALLGYLLLFRWMLPGLRLAIELFTSYSLVPYGYLGFGFIDNLLFQWGVWCCEINRVPRWSDLAWFRRRPIVLLVVFVIDPEIVFILDREIFELYRS